MTGTKVEWWLALVAGLLVAAVLALIAYAAATGGRKPAPRPTPTTGVQA